MNRTDPTVTGTNRPPIRVFVVDDHPVVRFGLRLLFDRQPDIEVVGEAAGLREAHSALPTAKPDVALVDVSLQDGDGLDLVGWIRDRLPDCRCLVITMYDDDLLAGPALAAGAHGLASKSTDEERLLQAVRRVSVGEVALAEDSVNALLRGAVDRPTEKNRPRAIENLTKRELQVFRLMGEGLGPKVIGDQLRISTKTVEAYQAKLKDKLGLATTLEVRRRASLWASGRRDDGDT